MNCLCPERVLCNRTQTSVNVNGRRCHQLDSSSLHRSQTESRGEAALMTVDVSLPLAHWFLQALIKEPEILILTC